LVDRITKKAKTVFVPILNPKNMGKNITIDDKNIDGKGYTIVANKDMGKIILLMTATKSRLIMEALDKIPVGLRMKVQTISKDLAENYDWFARTMFMNATRVADKFHVIKLALEELQAVRIRHRQVILTAERKLREGLKKEGKSLKNLPPPKRFENDETIKEILAKSRYLLFKFKSEWDEFQAERAKILFREFPEIEQVYDLMCSFRNFYKCKIGNKQNAIKSLNKWYAKTKEIKIDEVQNLLEADK
jgi:transposase